MTTLTPREIELKNKLYSQYKANKQDFIKKYGAQAESVMIGRAIKTAKNMASKEQQLRIKEIIKKSLSEGKLEEINSLDYIQTRKPKEDKEKNPIDTVRMDVPLLIRIMEFAKEEAKTDMELHSAAENMVELSKNDRILDMNDYFSIVSPDDNTDKKRLY